MKRTTSKEHFFQNWIFLLQILFLGQEHGGRGSSQMIVLKRTVAVDRHFDNQSGSHLGSQVNSVSQLYSGCPNVSHQQWSHKMNILLGSNHLPSRQGSSSSLLVSLDHEYGLRHLTVYIVLKVSKSCRINLFALTGCVIFFRHKFPGLFQESDWFFKGS